MIFLAALISYLVGSIPTAYIFGKLYKGIDIREHGSGNVGATNVFRTLGKGPGFLVLFIDILKGVLAVVCVGDWFQLERVFQRIVLAVAVVSGHNWTVFLKFKGGKGIATSLGVLVGLAVKFAVLRPVLLWTVLVWIVCFLITAIVSISSIAAATALPIIMLVTNQSLEVVLLGVIFSVFVVVRHRSNIYRLLHGQEKRVPLPFHKKK